MKIWSLYGFDVIYQVFLFPSLGEMEPLEINLSGRTKMEAIIYKSILIKR